MFVKLAFFFNKQEKTAAALRETNSTKKATYNINKNIVVCSSDSNTAGSFRLFSKLGNLYSHFPVPSELEHYLEIAEIQLYLARPKLQPISCLDPYRPSYNTLRLVCNRSHFHVSRSNRKAEVRFIRPPKSFCHIPE